MVMRRVRRLARSQLRLVQLDGESGVRLAAQDRTEGSGAGVTDRQILESISLDRNTGFCAAALAAASAGSRRLRSLRE
jgi:hypothetical protein